MLVTLYLAASLSAAPVPVQQAVYQAEKKSTPAQMVVLRVSRGSYGMRGCRTGGHRHRGGCATPSHASHGCGTVYSSGACGPTGVCSPAPGHPAPGGYPGYQGDPGPLPPAGQGPGSPSDQAPSGVPSAPPPPPPA
jgi:hypothetical protein